MPILEVIKEPNPLLHKVSIAVEKFDEELKSFMGSLLETMYKEEGMGIAAIQVGNPIRALIVDIPKRAVKSDDDISEGSLPHQRNPHFIINPKITYLSDEKIVLPEGCLSVKEADGVSFVSGEVERPISIHINYQDIKGQAQELKIDVQKPAEDSNDKILTSQYNYDLWFARCLQHEMDHLEGILFIDKLYNHHEIVGEISVVNDNVTV